jgi:two-component system NarL family sensor kinase
MDAATSRDVDAAVVSYANRGARTQVLLRGALVVFVILTIALLPPVQGEVACFVITGAYAVFAAGFAVWAWPGGPSVARWAWLGLFVDVAVLATLTLIAGVSTEHTWTDDVLLYGLFVIPILGATQLQPVACAAVVVPTTIVFFLSSVATRDANEEPWASVVLRTLALAAVGAGSVALSRIQRSRVAAIGGLLRDRTGLLDELVQLEDREREALAQQLHDGALQYVLAARQDLDDLRGAADAESVERIDYALTESSRLLRSKVTELHPAVLDRAGLPLALRNLAEAATRPGRAVDVDVAGWPENVRTSADGLLYGAARELLTNVVKHADATAVQVSLTLDGASARLVVADDGRGIDNGDTSAAVERGHLGLYTYRLRVEAAGGRLTLAPARPSGTRATVELPASRVGAA